MPRSFCCLTKLLPCWSFCSLTKLMRRSFCCLTKLMPRSFCCLTKLMPRSFCCLTCKLMPRSFCCLMKLMPKSFCCLTKLMPRSFCCLSFCFLCISRWQLRILRLPLHVASHRFQSLCCLHILSWRCLCIFSRIHLRIVVLGDNLIILLAVWGSW